MYYQEQGTVKKQILNLIYLLYQIGNYSPGIQFDLKMSHEQQQS